MRRVRLERGRQVGLEPAPVRQPRESVGFRLDPAVSQQAVVLRQRERHAHESERKRGRRQQQHGEVELQGRADADHAQRDRARANWNEQPRPVGSRGGSGSGVDEGRCRHADGARRDQRVSDQAEPARDGEEVHQVAGLPGQHRAAQQDPHRVHAPARKRDGAHNRPQQDEIADRVREARGRLPERRAGCGVDRQRQRDGRQQRGRRESADQPVQARRQQRVAHALADQDEQSQVGTRVDRQPQRVVNDGTGTASRSGAAE